MTWRIERLSEAHDVKPFRCGEHALDLYLKRHAIGNDVKGLGSTYVAIDDATQRVLGYVTLCSGAVDFADVPNPDLPRYPIPTILFARLAVDRIAQGAGVGTELVLAALATAVKVASRLGVFAVTVDAMNDRARAYYVERFGFSELLDDPKHLFVTIADLRSSGIS